jgi:hypothetical protein
LPWHAILVQKGMRVRCVASDQTSSSTRRLQWGGGNENQDHHRPAMTAMMTAATVAAMTMMTATTVWRAGRPLSCRHSVAGQMTSPDLNPWRICRQPPLILLDLQGNRCRHTVARRNRLAITHTVARQNRPAMTHGVANLTGKS